MPTLIESLSGSGRRRRCDGTCHSAKGPVCRCICGGLYHGRARTPGGLSQAVKEHTDKVLAAGGDGLEDAGLGRFRMVPLPMEGGA